MKGKHVLVAIAATGGAAVGLHAADKKPNIVWIFSDDHAYQAIGAYNSRLKGLNPTPNIDAIAKDGMIFERCYVANSICAPSRATLLTGKHSHMNGKLNNRGPFNQDQQTFPKILRKNGYQTAMIGKIHLSGKMQGFDYWEVLPGQGAYNDPSFITEKGKTQYKGYSTDIIIGKALDWMKNKRDKSKPFLVMIHTTAPHRTLIPAARNMERYEDVTIPEPDTLFDTHNTKTSASNYQKMTIANEMKLDYDLKVKKKYDKQFEKRNRYFASHKMSGKELTKWKYQQYMKDYLRCIWAVDENIGKVLKYLKDNGLDKNSVVMYSSDQGFYLGEHGWFDKRFMYEESFRTPLIVKWPGVVKPGSVNKDLVQNIDFAETFLDIAGAPIPKDMQGRSLVPLLKGEKPKEWRTSLYYHYYEFPGGHNVRRHEGISGKRFKLIRFYGRNYTVKDPETGKKVKLPPDDEWEFYDLQNDPHEMKNQYNNPEFSSEIKRMKEGLKALKKQYKVPKSDK